MTISDYTTKKIADLAAEKGLSEQACLNKILTLGIYQLNYRATMADRAKLVKAIGKATVAGDMETVVVLAEQLKATYAS